MVFEKAFKNKAAVLWIIFIGAFALRLYFSILTDLSFDSFLALNEARSIMTSGFPLHEHAIVFPPAFYYFMALFYKSKILLDIINSALFASVTFLAYYTALELTKDEDASLFSAAMASFIPIFFSGFIGKMTPYSLFIPLIFLFYLAFLKMKSEKFLYLAIALSFTLPRTSLAAIFIVPTLILYLILDKILNLHPDKKESELILLSIFVIPWAIFIFFKKPFEIYGLSTIYGNVPDRIMMTYFSAITIPQAITMIGILPLLFGIFAIYLKIFNPNEKDRSAHILISFVIVLALALWQRMMDLEFALTLIGISLAMLSAFSFKDLISFIKKTKISKEKDLILASLVFLIVLTLLFPSISYGLHEEKEMEKEELINALNSISITLDGSDNASIRNAGNYTIMSSPKEGYLIQYITGIKPVLDESYLLVEDANSIYEDIYKTYTTPFETDALSLLNKYEVRYIIVDDAVREEFGISELRYVNDKTCFKEAYSMGDEDKSIRIYEVTCRLR